MVETLPPLTANEQIVKWDNFIWKLAHKYAGMNHQNREGNVDDMHNEIVASALKYWSSYDPARGAVSTWLNWIAKSRFLNQRLRRLQTLPTASICFQGVVGDDDQDWSGTFPDLNAVDVADELDRKLRTEAINAAIGQLSIEEQEAVRKYFWRDSNERSTTRPRWTEALTMNRAMATLRPLMERFRDDDFTSVMGTPAVIH